MTTSTARAARARALAIPAAAVALGLVALAAAPATANAPVPTSDQAPADAASFLVGELTDGDHLEGPFGPEYGPTIDIGLGLAAEGSQPETVAAITAYMTAPAAVSGYVHGGDPDEIYAGASGKLGFFTSLVGGDPRDVGGEDLVATLQSLEGENGRFSDVSQYGDFSNTLTQAFGVLSLTAAADVEPSDASVQLLVDAQCDDGSWTLGFAGGDCAGTPDATGVVVQALNASDPDESAPITDERRAALERAADWLVQTRQADGSFLLGGTPNINTTGYGALGVLAVGLDSTSTVGFLASVQLEDGGLPMQPGMGSDAYATAQALPAFVLDSFLSLDPSVVLPAVVLDDPDPTTPPTTPTTAPPTTTVSTSPEPTGTTLPPTGASSGSVLGLVGVGLLGAGVLTVLAARRSLARA